MSWTPAVWVRPAFPFRAHAWLYRLHEHLLEALQLPLCCGDCSAAHMHTSSAAPDQAVAAPQLPSNPRAGSLAHMHRHVQVLFSSLCGGCLFILASWPVVWMTGAFRSACRCLLGLLLGHDTARHRSIMKYEYRICAAGALPQPVACSACDAGMWMEFGPAWSGSCPASTNALMQVWHPQPLRSNPK